MACRLARGQTCDPRELYVPPRLVVQRDSTGACHHDDPIVSAARRFLLAHLEDDISVDDVAEACRVGRSTLDRVFRSAEGRGPAAVLREMRLERAKQLLITTDLPLADVAARCGFNYLSHFSRAFKEQTGQSPSGWRREHSSP
jgi:transcriptional regulator GlxA family with amidase domain